MEIKPSGKAGLCLWLARVNFNLQILPLYMNDSELYSTVEALAAKCIRLEAKCYALSVCVSALAIRQGVSPEKAAATIEKQIDLAHQKLLGKIEDLDPGTAANLDRRSSLGDIFG